MRPKNLGSRQSLAIEELRRVAERLSARLDIYAAEAGTALIYAKLVVSDREQLIVGSANLTGCGLGTNVEAGALLGEMEARQVRLVIDGMISSGLVRKVLSTYDQSAGTQ